jgi:hypothetical protein
MDFSPRPENSPENRTILRISLKYKMDTSWKFIKIKDWYIIRKRFSGGTTLQQNHEEILDNGLCHFFHSPTSLNLFSHLTSLSLGKKWIHHRNALPYIYTSKQKKNKDISFDWVTSPLSTARWPDGSLISLTFKTILVWNIMGIPFLICTSRK